MTAKEFGGWVEFFDLEPFGWEADCFRSGTIAATIANVNRDPKKKSKPFQATDFIPGYRAKPAKIDGKTLKAQLQLAYAGLSGLKNKGEKAKGNPSHAPNQGERNKSIARVAHRGSAKRGVANKGGPKKKRDKQDTIDG